MKERPILFSGAMVRAILAGRKTQTRRVAKTVTSLPDGKGYTCLQKPGSNTVLPLVGGQWQWQPAAGDDWQPYPHIEEYCPYGKPGDRLWVRETWSDDALCMYPCPRVWYRASDSIDRNDGHTCPKESRGRYADCLACWEDREGRKFKWKPSIFMRRHHCRIVLQIVAVRVERLQEITRQDAIAEGIHRFVVGGCEYFHWRKEAPTEEHFNSAVMAYRDLWQLINGPHSWATNPWVWVVEFKRL